MKHYLWAGVALLFIGAYASDNPFALEENFGKLEKEQEVLLDKLRKIAEAKELAEEQEIEDDPIIEETPIVEETPKVVDVSTVEVKEALPKIDAEEKLEVMRQNALEASKKEAEERELLLAAAKAKEVEILKIKEEDQKRIEIAKKEAEAREVEAYEKARADRLAKEEAEKESVKKEAMKKEAAEKKIIENKEIAIVENKEDESTSIDDINITKERLEEKLKADEEFAEAVQEMGEEE